MGCDIHYVVEQKQADGIWLGIFATDTPIRLPYGLRQQIPLWRMKNRDYAFFAALAGVRGDGPGAIGLPPDVSHATRVYVELRDGDGHSHSHCSLYIFVLKHMLAIGMLPQMATHKLTGAGADPVMEYVDPEHNLGNWDDYRVCFWFDN